MVYRDISVTQVEGVEGFANYPLIFPIQNVDLLAKKCHSSLA